MCSLTRNVYTFSSMIKFMFWFSLCSRLCNWQPVFFVFFFRLRVVDFAFSVGDWFENRKLFTVLRTCISICLNQIRWIVNALQHRFWSDFTHSDIQLASIAGPWKGLQNRFIDMHFATSTRILIELQLHCINCKVLRRDRLHDPGSMIASWRGLAIKLFIGIQGSRQLDQDRRLC